MPPPVLPHSLKIGTRRYKVVVQQHVAPAGLMGQVDYNSCLITVATHRSRSGLAADNYLERAALTQRNCYSC